MLGRRIGFKKHPTRPHSLPLVLLGAIPSWPYSRSWGYGPSGIVGVVQSVRDHSVTLKSGDAKLEVLKSAISEVAKTPGANG